MQQSTGRTSTGSAMQRESVVSLRRMMSMKKYKSDNFKPLYEVFICYGQEEFFEISDVTPSATQSKPNMGQQQLLDPNAEGEQSIVMNETHMFDQLTCDNLLAMRQSMREQRAKTEK